MIYSVNSYLNQVLGPSKVGSMTGEKTRYATISLPIGIIREIDNLIEQLQYWPSRGAFVREACLEKIREEQRRLRALRNPDNENTNAPEGA